MGSYKINMLNRISDVWIFCLFKCYTRFYYEPLYDLNIKNFTLQDLKITSPFVVKVIIAVFTSIIISFPYFIFELLNFIYPAISKISKLYLFKYSFYQFYFFTLDVHLVIFSYFLTQYLFLLV